IVANLTPTRLAMLSILNAFANEKILAFANLEDARDWIVKTESL
ncbi:MAG: hypothetical protein RIS47_239, partial [Bacteroidota bacterium]